MESDELMRNLTIILFSCFSSIVWVRIFDPGMIHVLSLTGPVFGCKIFIAGFPSPSASGLMEVNSLLRWVRNIKALPVIGELFSWICTSLPFFMLVILSSIWSCPLKFLYLSSMYSALLIKIGFNGAYACSGACWIVCGLRWCLFIICSSFSHSCFFSHSLGLFRMSARLNSWMACSMSYTIWGCQNIC